MKLEILKTEALPEFEYFKEPQKKSQIVLHHTVSSIGKYVDDWFKADKGKSKVAVAYVVDKDGTIFELFDPVYWAWHIGKGSNSIHNKRSIAIEIVNEGVLEEKDDKYYWFDGKYEYKGKIYDNKDKWRGFQYFAPYTKEQVIATNLLAQYLINRFSIAPRFSNTLNYDKNYLDFMGVVMHCNLRSDKTDLSPAYPLKDTNKAIINTERIFWKDIKIKPYEKPAKIEVPKELKPYKKSPSK